MATNRKATKQQIVWSPPLPPGRAYKKANFAELAQVSQFIYQAGEFPMLRTPARKVTDDELGSNTFQRKLRYLKDCMLQYRKITGGKGRGMAAPQVGIHERFAVIYMPEQQDNQFFVIVNPIITEKATTMLTFPEACMSCNSLIATVRRPAWIRFSYRDENGEQHEWTTTDETDRGRMYNRIFAHEIDHLDGILNIDYVAGKDLIFESSPNEYEQATFQKAE